MNRNIVLLEKLKKAFIDHGKIVVGVDFDDTIFPYSDISKDEECEQVRDLLRKIRPYTIQCLWTVANEWSLKYKKFICIELYDMQFDHYNESPINYDPTVQKPHFNVLLDDSSGLDSVIKVLEEFYAWVIVVGDEPFER